MKPPLQRRIARLERAAIEKASVSSEPITVRSFTAQVEERMRLTRESFPEAAQTLVARLRDDELKALLREAEESESQSGVPSPTPFPATIDSPH